MATWFVDGTNGSDSNDGTVAATGGGHGPFLTIGKAIAASGAAGSGDTVWIAPGRYHQAVSLGVSPTSELQVIGDVRRAQAWASSTPNGAVIWDNYVTNDWTLPGSAPLTINGKSHFTFQDLWILAGSTNALIDATTTGTTSLKFSRCLLQGRCEGSGSGISFTGTAGTDPAVTFDQCIIAINQTTPVLFTMPTSAGGNYTATITLTNCLFYSVAATQVIQFTTSGAQTGKPGGAIVRHCTFICVAACVNVNASWQAGSAGVTIEDCVPLMSGNATLCGGTGTNISSNYNHYPAIGGGATAGANDVAATYLPPLLFEIGQSWLWDLPHRPPFTPWPGSLFLGFGEGSGTDTVDLLNRPRPSGGGQTQTTAATTGTATAGSATTLTDGGAAWTVNAFTGYICTITSGTGSGQRRWIKSNTATAITVVSWATTPDNTSHYSIDPPGALKAVGAIEYHDPGVAASGATGDGGSGGYLQQTGPCNDDFVIAVDAQATVISVKVAWDSNHGNTNKPRAILLASLDIGITADEDATQYWHESKTATGTAGSAFETLTFTSIVPTAKGLVTLRLQGRPAQGNGLCYWDTVQVT